MDGKVYFTDLFANEEFSESSPKKARVEKQSLLLDDPMEIDTPEENLLKPNYSYPLIVTILFAQTTIRVAHSIMIL